MEVKDLLLLVIGFMIMDVDDVWYNDFIIGCVENLMVVIGLVFMLVFVLVVGEWVRKNLD